VTEISETLCLRKKLLISEENSSSTFQIASAKMRIHINYNDIYFDNKFKPVKETNDNIDSNYDIDSKDEISDDSNNEYDIYDGYNEYGECDSSYYYHDERYEKKISLMMSSIISLVII